MLQTRETNNQNHGVPPWLSGFVCAFHPATLGSNPEHTIYGLINLNLNLICEMLKKMKINRKRGPFFKKNHSKEHREGAVGGSVGRAVVSDTRGLRFESSHRRFFT